ncbi:MAG: GntR family transcriptional regulator [Steroidobacteraceae bacterium]
MADSSGGARGAGRLPRYRQVADELIGEILGGRLRVGATLPGEFDLVERFGVSRHTVREALRQLGELGLIERHQGVGTVVRAREPAVSYVHSVRSPAELMNYPRESRLTVLAQSEVKLGRRLARELGARAGASWVHIAALRRLRPRGLPICWSDIYVVPEYASVAALIGRRTKPVYELIEQRFGEHVEQVEVLIRGGVVADAHAAALEVAPGSPTLTVVRRYAGRGGRIIEVSVSEHPADRFTYSLQLQRGWSAGERWTPR